MKTRHKKAHPLAPVVIDAPLYTVEEAAKGWLAALPEYGPEEWINGVEYYTAKELDLLGCRWNDVLALFPESWRPMAEAIVATFDLEQESLARFRQIIQAARNEEKREPLVLRKRAMFERFGLKWPELEWEGWLFSKGFSTESELETLIVEHWSESLSLVVDNRRWSVALLTIDRFRAAARNARETQPLASLSFNPDHQWPLQTDARSIGRRVYWQYVHLSGSCHQPGLTTINVGAPKPVVLRMGFYERKVAEHLVLYPGRPLKLGGRDYCSFESVMFSEVRLEEIAKLFPLNGRPASRQTLIRAGVVRPCSAGRPLLTLMDDIYLHLPSPHEWMMMQPKRKLLDSFGLSSKLRDLKGVFAGPIGSSDALIDLIVRHWDEVALLVTDQDRWNKTLLKHEKLKAVALGSAL